MLGAEIGREFHFRHCRKCADDTGELGAGSGGFLLPGFGALLTLHTSFRVILLSGATRQSNSSRQLQPFLINDERPTLALAEH